MRETLAATFFTLLILAVIVLAVYFCVLIWISGPLGQGLVGIFVILPLVISLGTRFWLWLIDTEYEI